MDNEEKRVCPPLKITIEGEVQSGTIEQLCDYLLTKPNLHFIQNFRLTYFLFVTPSHLLHLLIERSCFHFDHEKLHSADDKRRVIEKKLRFANTIKNFGENLGSDPEMARELSKFVEQLRDPPPCSNMKVWDFLRQKLEQNLQRIPVQFLEEGKDICSASLIPEGVVELSFASSIEERKELDIERLDLLQLAREISLIDNEIFSKIFPKDLGRWVWDKKKDSAISQLIRFSKHLSSLVITSIVLSKKPKKIFTLFVSLCSELLSLGNLNGSYAILEGLLSPFLSEDMKNKSERLQEITNLLSTDRCSFFFLQGPKRFESLFHQFLITKRVGWKELRLYMKRIDFPATPYLGMYLTDLHFILEGNQNLVTGGEIKIINFRKCNLVGSVIRELCQFQDVKYRFESDWEIRRSIFQSQPLTKAQMIKYLSSSERE